MDGVGGAVMTVLDWIKVNVEFYGQVGAGLIFGVMMGSAILLVALPVIWLWR